MNIQLSIIVWTVICFLLLMLILKNLLFAPVLNMLDSRRKKIEDARKKKEHIAQLTAEHEKYIAEQTALDISNKKAQAKQNVQKIQSDGKKEIEAAQRKCLDDIKEYRDGITEEYDRIVSSVAPEMETAAAIFAKNIISDRV